MAVDQLDAVFAALADPTRRAILARLAQGEANVAELAEPFPISQPAVSKHLRVLEGAGLISRAARGTARYSRLEAEPLRRADEWMQSYKRFWSESFDKLDAALAAYLREPVESHEPPVDGPVIDTPREDTP
ncbi:MAG: winged helix-turn-helix transcriptional regulator [Actinomycetales bacterium]|nr:winged helix-turn-helix transcriptional regulator [Actinomycetales bacterium]